MGKLWLNIEFMKKIPDDFGDETELVPKVFFYAEGPLAGQDGGNSIYDEDELSLKRVFFYSGCSIPFSAEIQFRDEKKELKFDPFSGYILKAEE